jgi:outer membrane protein insertion porin family/translocation and assembly module TamA
VIRPALVAAALLSAIATSAAAQRQADISCAPGDIEVRSLKFIGNEAHSDYVLERGIATTPSTWWRRTLGIGKKYCLDSLATLVEDSARLSFQYKRTGYPDVRIEPVITPSGRLRVDVAYRITEGAPMILDSLGIEWTTIDSLGFSRTPLPDSMRYIDDLPIEEGDRFSTVAIEAARDSITRRLRNRGYPEAEVLRDFSTDYAAHRAEVTYRIYPGRKSYIGTINIPEPVPAIGSSRARIDTARVRGLLGIHEGDLFDASTLESVRRGLFLTEAFRYVGVEVDTTTLRDSDSLVTVNVVLVESQLLATRASIGWGNLDCIRAQVNHTNYNFLGGLRRLDLNTRISKVGYAKPVDFGGESLCRQLGNDPFSDTLNYYASATLSQASLFGLRIVPSLTLYSERRSEYKAFLRETPFGLIASAQQGVGTTLPMTWTYQLEFGRTVAQPAFFCAVFNVCETEARQRLEEETRSAVVGWNATRNRIVNPVNPTSGSVVRLDLRHASRLVGSNRDASFNRATIDATWYRPAVTGALVMRFRAGAVVGTRLGLTGAAPRFIPLQERLYAGGPNSVRGFRQNELGPVVYLPERVDTIPAEGDSLFFLRAFPDSGERTVPTGGDNVIVANVELRLRSPAFPELMQWALFVDAGQVWNRGRSGTGVNFSDIRVTPGLGVRIFSPVGPIRVDVGYNGYRPAFGPAYFTSTTGSGNLICVSPENALRVRRLSNGGFEQVDEGDCPATYGPERGSFLRRLTFQFSIGQPF